MAPVFNIAYTSEHQRHAIRHETQWVCPAWFTDTQARESFERQNPSAAILHVNPWQQC